MLYYNHNRTKLLQERTGTSMTDIAKIMALAGTNDNDDLNTWLNKMVVLLIKEMNI